MKAVIYISGKIGTDTTLVDVIRQFKSYEDVTEVEAVINSHGGSKSEGDSIYSYLVGLDSEIPVTTRTSKAYSIAAKVFAAGRVRIVEDIDKAIMIHFAWAKAEGGAERFEEVAAALRGYEEEFVDFYSSHLTIEEDTVRDLLKNETFVSGAEAVALGFATELNAELKAVAEYEIDNSNINVMDKKKSLGKILLAAMAAFVAGEPVEAVAEVVLQDSNANELTFPDVAEGELPIVGSAATVGGSAIEDGAYIMPSMDEATLTFEGGVVTEIKPKEEEVEAEVEVVAEEIQEVSVWSVNVTNNSFEMGEIVMYDYDGESYPVSAGEFQLKNGNRIITDASGKIVAVKTSEDLEEEPEVIVDAEASFEDLLQKMTEKVTAEVQASLEVKLAEKDAEILALKRKKGSNEINAEVIVEGVPAAKVANQNGLTGAFLRGKK